jgi:hypothetical protein
VKIINDLGMPLHAFTAICLRQGRLEPPTLDYIGVTTLMGAPLPRYLNARYWHQLEVKASETMNAIQGQLGHLLFDKVETTTISKIPLQVEHDGFTIKGEADYYDPILFTLGDNKFKQVNSVTAQRISKDDSLERQLNIYCWMARKMGYDVRHLQGDIYINGWTVYKSYGDSAYPKAPYLKVPIPIWEESFTANYVSERLRVHNTRAIHMLRHLGTHKIADLDHWEEEGDEIMANLDAAMMMIPVCTDEERFAQPTKYAVMRDGQKKAVKLFDNPIDAEAFCGPKMSVVERKGGYMKCQFYCAFRHGLCPHNKPEEIIQNNA